MVKVSGDARGDNNFCGCKFCHLKSGFSNPKIKLRHEDVIYIRLSAFSVRFSDGPPVNTPDPKEVKIIRTGKQQSSSRLQYAIEFAYCFSRIGNMLNGLT